ncbi:MAG: right-handed parallel beta-helix repeat-containing protein, partial [Verrucomicrobiales bacterium]|nr:right-handed parallel beta-helix repeat-containing protein [Verrucomicrobiales bacterium]
TNGNDLNPGTVELPFATPQRAVTNAALAPGDIIYVRGGVYMLNTPVKPAKHGTATNYIRLWAYPGETPIFDFSGMSTVEKALDVRRNYWHVKGIVVRYAPDNGIFVAGLGNIIEGCTVHDCKNDGFVLGSTSARCTNALILNCDSYRNFQPSSGGNNGDGFAAKAGAGPGNVFIGCRAWHNSDDGWDFYYNTNCPVVLSNCWAFMNGYDLWGVGTNFSGNGNGFKLGGAGTRAGHFLTNCVAFCNANKGFDHNHSQAGQTIVNCTGYSNRVNFSFYETPAVGTNLLINNVAFERTPTNLDPTTIQISNSWQHFVVSAADFASLDVSLALAPRGPDYTLPTNAFLRLAHGSRLIDAGANVGLPYLGAAPDLGAFEFVPAAPEPGPFRILSIELLPTNAVQLRWESVPGMSYRVEATERMCDASWVLRQLVLATGTVSTCIEPATGAAQRYFRVVLTTAP